MKKLFVSLLFFTPLAFADFIENFTTTYNGNIYTWYAFDTVDDMRDFCSPSVLKNAEDKLITSIADEHSLASDKGYVYFNKCKGGSKEDYFLGAIDLTDSPPVLTPQEQCLADGDYWYNSQCNSSPEPIVSACVSGAGSNVIKTLEGGDFSIPSNIC